MHEIAVPVSILVKDLKNAVEGAFGFVAVRGELTNLSRAYSGHIYFTLKDNESQIRCALFKNQQRLNHAEIKADSEYIVYGKISVYEPRSEITLIASLIVPAGEGLAAMQLKMLKEKLKNEGVFDASHKKSLPEYPETVAVITAEGGAAIHDIIKVSRNRFPPARIILAPSSVQGKDAHKDLIKALERVALLENIDAVIIGRGGGAKEDLDAFNSEELARAVIKCKYPVVSAVGHETDSTILDMAASYSVSTPSAAAELIFPDSFAILQEVENSIYSVKKSMESALNTKSMYLDNLVLSLKNPSEVINSSLHRTEKLLMTASNAISEIIFRNFERLSYIQMELEKNNPLSPLERGFAIINQQSHTVKRLASFNISESFKITFKDGTVEIKK